jgi:alpha/beta superfamily hydrolase
MTPLSSPEPIVVEAVRFQAGPHHLEGELAYPETTPTGALAVLAGPHPLLGGTLHNNVVRALGDSLAGHGLATLRFNYRGVGLSEGPPLNQPGHLAEFWQHSRLPEEEVFRHDLSGAVAFLCSLGDPFSPLALVGYSFGCTLLPWAVPAERPVALVLIAPVAGRHDLDALIGLAGPKLVIAPQGDFAADGERLVDWFGRLRGPKRLLQPCWDGHFFRRHEEELVDLVADFLASAWR